LVGRCRGNWVRTPLLGGTQQSGGEKRKLVEVDGAVGDKRREEYNCPFHADRNRKSESTVQLFLSLRLKDFTDHQMGKSSEGGDRWERDAESSLVHQVPGKGVASNFC